MTLFFLAGPADGELGVAGHLSGTRVRFIGGIGLRMVAIPANAIDARGICVGHEILSAREDDVRRPSREVRG